MSPLLILVLLVAAVFGTCCGVGVLGLFIALHIFLQSVLPDLTTVQYLLLAAFCLAPPLAAYLAACLLSHFSLGELNQRVFTVPAMVLAFAVVLNSDGFFNFLEAAVLIVQQGNAWKSFSLFLACGNAVIFCGALIALVVMLLQLLLELPVLWLAAAKGNRVKYFFSAVRPLTAVLVVAMAFNLIVGLFAEELWPTTWLAAAENSSKLFANLEES